MRLSGDGQLDPSFGVNGIERLDVVSGGSERSGIGDALLTREGLLYLGGSITRGSDSTGFVARMVVNVPPTAVIARPSRPLAGRPIALDASGSTDRDGRIVATRWTVDGVAQAATTVRLTAGSHRIGLTATDDEGARGTASLVIGVASGRLALAGKQRAYAVAKDGTVRLRAACAAPGRCEGVASLTRGKGSARRTYATAAYGVAPGKRRVVVLRVTKAGRKLLRKGPLRFRAVFAPPAGGGPTSVGTVKLTLAP